MNGLPLLKITFALLLACFCESALSPKVKKVYQSFLSGKGLYQEEDKIVILNATNINATIYGTGNSWLVEFYNSWCGHCHKFAPVWKSMALNINEWRKVVRLAALDCSVEEHTSLCRNYDIMGYPTIKIFPAYSQPSNLGNDFKRRSNDEKAITKDLVQLLQKEQMEGRGADWPNITPYRSYDTTSLWKKGDHVRFVFLIFAEEGDTIPVEVLLDLSNVEGIQIRSVIPGNEVLAKLLGVHKYPSVLVLRRSRIEPEFLYPKEDSREAFRQEIKQFLEKNNIVVPHEPTTFNSLSNDEEPSFSELGEARHTLLHIEKMKELGDVVFLVDLENTLKYNLGHEISSKKVISGEALAALNRFLNVLIKYFPVGEDGMHFLQKLHSKVSSVTEIQGSQFKSYLNEFSEKGIDSVLLTKKKWMACRGSDSHFRGFPCGMWTMFHFMTVNAIRDFKQPQFNPLEVLEAMLGYVTYFFGCSDCSSHFQQMCKDKMMREKVTTAEEAVLWLWSAHNTVNNRLAKDPTEDPEFPKIQFPSPEKCPTCRNADGHWNDQNVFNYLISVYNVSHLNLLGAKNKLYDRNPGEHSNQSNSEHLDDTYPKKISKDFNLFDISLCVVLYILSAVICVGVCLKFLLKRRHRKKSPNLDLCGKV